MRKLKMFLMSGMCIVYPWCQEIPLIGPLFHETCSHQANLGWGDRWRPDGEGGSYLSHGPTVWVCVGDQTAVNTPANIR